MESLEERKRKMHFSSPIIPTFHHSNTPAAMKKAPYRLSANGAFHAL
jgi:hypothetical protein